MDSPQNPSTKPADPLSQLEEFQPRSNCPYPNLTSRKISDQIKKQLNLKNTEPSITEKIANQWSSGQNLVRAKGNIEDKIKFFDSICTQVASAIEQDREIICNPDFRQLCTDIANGVHSATQEFADHFLTSDTPTCDEELLELRTALKKINQQIDINIKGCAFTLIAGFKESKLKELLASLQSIDMPVNDEYTVFLNRLLKPQIITIIEVYLKYYLEEVVLSGSQEQRQALSIYNNSLLIKAAVLSGDYFCDDVHFNLSRGIRTAAITIAQMIRVCYIHSCQAHSEHLTANIHDPQSLSEFIFNHLQSSIKNPYFTAQLLRLADLRQNTFITLLEEVEEKNKFSPDNFHHDKDLHTAVFSDAPIARLIKKIKEDPDYYHAPNPGCPGKQLVKSLADAFTDIALRHLEKYHSFIDPPIRHL